MGDLRQASLSRTKGNNVAFKEDKETTQTVPWMSYDRESKIISRRICSRKSLSTGIVLFEFRRRFSVNREFSLSLLRKGGLCRKNPC